MGCNTYFVRLSWDLYDFVREVSLLTILCKMLAVFVTLACMLDGLICMLGTTRMYAMRGSLWLVGPNMWAGFEVTYGMWYFDRLPKLCAYSCVVKTFQVPLVPKGKVYRDRTTSPWFLFLIVIWIYSDVDDIYIVVGFGTFGCIFLGVLKMKI